MISSFLFAVCGRRFSHFFTHFKTKKQKNETVWPDNWKTPSIDFVKSWLAVHVADAAAAKKPLLLEVFFFFFRFFFGREGRRDSLFSFFAALLPLSLSLTSTSQNNEPNQTKEHGKWLKPAEGADLKARDAFYATALDAVYSSASTGGPLKGSLYWQWIDPGSQMPRSEGGGRGEFISLFSPLEL